MINLRLLIGCLIKIVLKNSIISHSILGRSNIRKIRISNLLIQSPKKGVILFGAAKKVEIGKS
jgi:hypothetical protein